MGSLYIYFVLASHPVNVVDVVCYILHIYEGFVYIFDNHWKRAFLPIWHILG